MPTAIRYSVPLHRISHELRAAHRRRANDHARHAKRQYRFHIRHRPNAAAQLDRRACLLDHALDDVVIRVRTVLRTVQSQPYESTPHLRQVKARAVRTASIHDPVRGAVITFSAGAHTARPSRSMAEYPHFPTSVNFAKFAACANFISSAFFPMKLATEQAQRRHHRRYAQTVVPHAAAKSTSTAGRAMKLCTKYIRAVFQP